MIHIDQLLDQIKARHAIGSDYKLAAYLGVVPGAVKHWRHGRSLPDPSTAALIADELEMDAELLVAELEIHRAQNEKTRAIWERMAARLQAGTVHSSALFAILVVLGFITSPPNAHAVVTDLSTTNQSVYYV
ncbi:hypothetical protein [Hydrogenophaga sp.]|uniref:hypothetical protein n=1 Tax=Hydrogenophaga sp. TaxID=1904254 RepID=UPI00272FE759|nr:hypothetical protein [Hydrogenophaga sp.]MDP1688037.1 hypothetical protein [Hydrogenophaga sp.]